MNEYIDVKKHQRLKRKRTVWLHRGDDKMLTVQVPSSIKSDVYKIAVILDNITDNDDRLEAIRKVLVD